MISLVESMAWSVPYIKLSFSYEKRRSGANMQYQVTVTIDSLTGDPYFGYPIYLKLKFGDNFDQAITSSEISDELLTKIEEEIANVSYEQVPHQLSD